MVGDKPGISSRWYRFIRLPMIALFFLLWQLAPSLGLVSPLILAPPSDIVTWIAGHGLEILPNLEVTAFEILAAIAITWPLAILSGLLIGGISTARDAISPFFEALFAIPFILLYPLLIAWFGFGIMSKILFSAAYGYFPIALNTITAVKSIDSNYLNLAKSLGLPRFSTLRRIVLPMIVPSVFSGLRIGTGLIVIGVIVTEMLASYSGIGYLISWYRSLLETSAVFSMMILAIIVVMVVTMVMRNIEKRENRWRRT